MILTASSCRQFTMHEKCDELVYPTWIFCSFSVRAKYQSLTLHWLSSPEFLISMSLPLIFLLWAEKPWSTKSSNLHSEDLKIWYYGLSSFQWNDSKLDKYIFLAKNQHYHIVPTNSIEPPKVRHPLKRAAKSEVIKIVLFWINFLWISFVERFWWFLT